MADNVTDALQVYEQLVKDGKLATFFVSIDNHKLLIRTSGKLSNQTIPVPTDLYDSLNTFFYDIKEIEYNSQDYISLKSLVHARHILQKLLKQEPSS